MEVSDEASSQNNQARHICSQIEFPIDGFCCMKTSKSSRKSRRLNSTQSKLLSFRDILNRSSLFLLIRTSTSRQSIWYVKFDYELWNFAVKSFSFFLCCKIDICRQLFKVFSCYSIDVTCILK